ncbi:hypothetical protein GCM10027160_52180 [Streptomyces calidiresistens]|uniref:Uncharacterized protein n=1 Tax=Streptomyces calidiresistens TaxID=1485586 RepID=A0A7W3T791_9ACTN|nr:hypothetical protein [Streptomyces calidiresistens]MBB0231986.1 hypothetical protein [Streptomyces calidiresistens]
MSQPTPPQPRTRAQNQARHWQQRQADAAARGPAAVASVWFDAARMVAKQRALNGSPEVWDDLAKTLKAFYERHAR